MASLCANIAIVYFIFTALTSATRTRTRSTRSPNEITGFQGQISCGDTLNGEISGTHHTYQFNVGGDGCGVHLNSCPDTNHSQTSNLIFDTQHNILSTDNTCNTQLTLPTTDNKLNTYFLQVGSIDSDSTTPYTINLTCNQQCIEDPPSVHPYDPEMTKFQGHIACNTITEGITFGPLNASNSFHSYEFMVGGNGCIISLDTCDFDRETQFGQFAGYDSQISIFQDGEEIASNDDFCDLGAAIYDVELDHEEDRSYMIRIGGTEGATGFYRLSLSCNEKCEQDLDVYCDELGEFERNSICHHIEARDNSKTNELTATHNVLIGFMSSMVGMIILVLVIYVLFCYYCNRHKQPLSSGLVY